MNRWVAEDKLIWLATGLKCIPWIPNNYCPKEKATEITLCKLIEFFLVASKEAQPSKEYIFSLQDRENTLRPDSHRAFVQDQSGRACKPCISLQLHHWNNREWGCFLNPASKIRSHRESNSMVLLRPWNHYAAGLFFFIRYIRFLAGSLSILKIKETDAFVHSSGCIRRTK